MSNNIPAEQSYKPTLSVITVVYNNVRDIERTLLSVLGQTYPCIEYIVIDGGSTDGTLEILERYRNRLAVLVSKPDRGIYDAMNKGLEKASGDYVLFMNSGDEIHDPRTVENVFAFGRGSAALPNVAANHETSHTDIYYGETELYDESWQPLGLRRHRTPEHFDWKSFRYGMNISHQAIYVRRAIAPFYDPRYKLSADVDWVIKAAKKARKITNTHQVVAKYLVGGLSKKRHRQSLKERFLIFSRHYGLLPTVFNHFMITLRYLRHRLLHGKPLD